MSNDFVENDVPAGPSYAGLIIGLVLVAGLWGGTWLLIPWLFPVRAEAGQFGDMFGVINSLFSGFAFSVLIYTIYLQRRELALQRRELILTRNELSGQKEVLKAQNATFQKQNFEDTFFQLLGLQNDIVGSIDLPDPHNPSHGRGCFSDFYGQFHYFYKYSSAKDMAGIDAAYQRFYSEHQAQVGHYFRSLYTLVKFVDRSEVKDKKFYTNIIRAQLSSFELLLLYYNGLSKLGCDKFKPLIERYALLKTVPRNELVHSEDIRLYGSGAFE